MSHSNLLCARLALFSSMVCVIVLCSPPAYSQPAETGAVAGTVSNPATQKLLEGATVEVEGFSQIRVVTDRQGTFRIDRVPAGMRTVIVTYPGLDAKRQAISVSAGRTAHIDVKLQSDVYELGAFSVVGEREGNSLAMAIQKAAPNVKNVISADAYGSVSDANVGNLVQRLPDVSADFSIADTTYVRVRGIDPNLNAITVDGTRMANEDLISMRRQFRFNQFSIVNIEKIEITKAPTPDMDADSIGGSINLVSKSAFDSDPVRRYGGTFGFNYRLTDHPNEGKFDYNLAKRQLTTKLQPNASVFYSDVVGARRNFGIRVDANFTPRYANQEQAYSQYQPTVSAPAYTWQYQLGDLRHVRTIAGIGIKLDYRMSERSSFALGFKYNYLHHTNENNGFTLQTSQAIATLDASGNRIGGGPIKPGFTNLITEALADSNTIAQLNVNKPREVYAPSRWLLFQGRHDLDGWKVDYDVNVSRAVSNIDHGDFGGTMQARMTGVGWILDRTRSNLTPTITQTVGENWYNLGSYRQLTLTVDDQRNGIDTIVGSQGNVQKTFATHWPVTVKSGLRFRQQTRINNRAQRVFQYAGPDGIIGVNPVTGRDDGSIAGFLDNNYTYQLFGRYTAFQFPSVPTVRISQRANPSWFQENFYTTYSSPLINSLRVRERVTAAYAMANVDIRKLGVLVGVRAERTDTDGKGPRRADRLGAARPNETAQQAQARALADWGGLERASGSYTNLFPGIHLKYSPIRPVVLRASWTNSIGRPTFDNIIPATRVDEVRETVSVTNPSIKPQFARSYDLTAEYYFKSAGLASVGAFQKDIRDFIQTLGSDVVPAGPNNGFGGNYAGYQLFANRNFGTATVQGVSFNLQQQFTFLPGALKGLGGYANYTYTRTEGTRADTAFLGPNGAPRLELGGFVPRTANFGISYSAGRLSLRAQVNYRGATSEVAGTNPSTVVQRARYVTLNTGGEYTLSNHASLYFDFINVTNEPENNVYLVEPSRVRNYNLQKAEISCGIKARF
jgi:iron complex outermembrane receptor protein